MLGSWLSNGAKRFSGACGCHVQPAAVEAEPSSTHEGNKISVLLSERRVREDVKMTHMLNLLCCFFQSSSLIRATPMSLWIW